MRRLLIALFLLGAARPGIPGDAAIRVFDLDDCLRYGLEHSLSLQNAALDEDVAVARSEGVNGLYDPRLAGSLTYSDSEIRDSTSFFLQDRRVTSAGVELGQQLRSGTRLGVSLEHSHIDAGGDAAGFVSQPYASSVTFSASQSILRNAFGAVDRARLRAARLGREAAALALQRERRMLAARIAEAYWWVYSAGKNFSAGRDSLARAETLRNTNRGRFDDDLIDETDLLASEALVAVRRGELRSVSNQLETAAEMLKNVIQLPPREWSSTRIRVPDDDRETRLAEPVKTSFERAAREALRQRTDLQALQKLAEQAESDVKIRESEFRHDLEVFGQYGLGDAADSRGESFGFGDDGWLIGVQAEIAWGRRAGQSALDEAELQARRAANNLAALEDAIGMECASAVRRVNVGLQRIADTVLTRDLQRRKLALEQEKFEQGRSSINWLIRYEDDYAAARIACNLALADYQNALVRYRLAVGDESLTDPDASSAPRANQQSSSSNPQ